MEFFLNSVLPWTPPFFFAVLFGVTVWTYWKRETYISFKTLSLLAILFSVFFALLLSGLQYYTWAQDDFTRLFLPPHQSVSYFLIYSGRFWGHVVLSLGSALLFWFLLRGLRMWSPESFKRNDISLGVLLVLIVGWPHVVVFVPLAFLLVLLLSIWRLVVMKNSNVSLGSSFLVAAFLVLIWGNEFISLLRLDVLRV